MIKLDFEFQTQHGIYRDALYLDDNHSFTEQEIESMKQERVDNWIAIITTPTEQVEEIIEEPTEEFLEEVDNG
jgi:ribosomal protein S16